MFLIILSVFCLGVSVFGQVPPIAMIGVPYQWNLTLSTPIQEVLKIHGGDWIEHIYCLSSDVTYVSSKKFNGVVVDGGVVYLSQDTTRALHLVNLTNSQLITTYNNTYGAMGLTVNKFSHLVYLYGSQLEIINVTDPMHPTLVGTYQTTEAIYDASVDDDLLYLVTMGSWCGLQVINVSDSSHPFQIGQVEIVGDFPISLIVVNHLAYVVGSNTGLFIIDLSLPTSPVVVGRCQNGASVDLAVDPTNQIVYVVDYSVGLTLIDVSNLSHPIVINRVTTGYANGIALHQGMIYISLQNHLLIIDSSNRTYGLRTVGQAPVIGGDRMTVDSLGQWLYVASRTGMNVVNLHTISSWVLSGTPSLNDTGQVTIQINGQTFYIKVDDCPRVVTNHLLMICGRSLILTSGNLNAEDSDDLPQSVWYTVNNQSHLVFQWVVNQTTTTTFTQQDINDGRIQLKHDGTFDPWYVVTVCDGYLCSEPSLSNVTLIFVPTVIAHQLTLNDGQTLIVTMVMLNVVDTFETPETLRYVVTNRSHLTVTLKHLSSEQFTQAEINADQVQLIHDRSNLAPVLELVVMDHDGFNLTIEVNITFIPSIPMWKDPISLIVATSIGGLVVFVMVIGAVIGGIVYYRTDRKSREIELGDQKIWHCQRTLRPRKGRVVHYKLIPAGEQDLQRVAECYQRCPVPGMDLKNVEIIYCPQLEDGFSTRIKLLQEKEGNPAFTPKWTDPNKDQLRNQVVQRLSGMSKLYSDAEYPSVKLLPVWHGTKPSVLDSIFKTGYANLATTDVGFFGKGIYGSYEAKYAYQVYCQGSLLINWVSYYSAYPVIDGDLAKLAGGANYGNFDAHFAPVRPRTSQLDEKNYDPCHNLSEAVYHEMVVFDPSQCLPRYLVTLQPQLTVPLQVQAPRSDQIPHDPKVQVQTRLQH